MRTLHLSTFQSFQAALEGQPLDFRGAKEQALLIYLAVEQGPPRPTDLTDTRGTLQPRVQPRVHSRSALAGLLWPDESESKARRYLSTSLLRLRNAIGDRDQQERKKEERGRKNHAGGHSCKAEPIIHVESNGLCINPNALLWVDALTFQELLAAIELHDHADAQTCARCTDHYRQAVELYSGPFLADFEVGSNLFEEWQQAQQAHFSQQALDAFAQLSACYAAQGQPERAIAITRRQLRLEPCAEEAHGTLMQLLAQTGQRSAALAQYDVLTQILMDELGVPPAPEMDMLYDAIVAGKIAGQAAGRGPAQGGDSGRPTRGETEDDAREGTDKSRGKNNGIGGSTSSGTSSSNSTSSTSCKDSQPPGYTNGSAQPSRPTEALLYPERVGLTDRVPLAGLNSHENGTTEPAIETPQPTNSEQQIESTYRTGMSDDQVAAQIQNASVQAFGAVEGPFLAQINAPNRPGVSLAIDRQKSAHDRQLSLPSRQLPRQSVAAQPITQPHLFYGRGKELARIISWWQTLDRPWILSIDGIGGIGKTTLAQSLVGTLTQPGGGDRKHPSRIAWVSAKQEEFRAGLGIQPTRQAALDVNQLVDEVLGKLTPHGLASTPQNKESQLAHLLKEQPTLVVIDNLESVADYEALIPALRDLANPSKFLITSRHSLSGYGDVYNLTLGELGAEDASKLLRGEATMRGIHGLSDASDEQWAQVASEIAKVVGGHPLALNLVLGQLSFLPLDKVLTNLKQATGQHVDALYNYIYWQAWQMLDLSARQLFLTMPMAYKYTYDQLAEVSKLAEEDFQPALTQLVALSLLQVSGAPLEPRYYLHRLTETFLLKEVMKWCPQ